MDFRNVEIPALLQEGQSMFYLKITTITDDNSLPIKHQCSAE
ncbi:hypothetical protein [Bowmanella sp. JS7-9]|uniref:Uncharacterized protein n=1 Tax=Pseudobowmanella zhangzhouensis TaxID=1537679 RepID=A0ABW1XH99_9ALTE|nr:hypothetical protein [Bowmanella sp. JS7-9]